MTDRDDTRHESLPEHEYRETEHDSVGGGLMREGGTAVDRGTGTLGGRAQGPAEDDGDDPVEDPVLGGNETLVDAQEVADLRRDPVDPAR